MPNGWRVTGASVQGASHKARGQSCQDAHAWCELPGGVLAAAVADGAGSVEFAETGAKTAVAAAIEAVRKAAEAEWPTDEAGWKGLLRRVIEQARAAVLVAAAAIQKHPRDLSST